jgi:16S rRNA (guanine(966)-N(2))-methyltransferase RsmD
LDFKKLKTLDLFGGTGNISYELASRGATDLTIVEKDTKMYDFIKKNITDLKIANVKVIRSEVFKYINECNEQYDFIFAGPPYSLQTIDDLPLLIFERFLLNPGGWFVLEHTPRNNYEAFAYYRSSRNYGSTVFSFFVNQFATTE